MNKIFLCLALIYTTNFFGQTASRVNNSQNVPKSISSPTVLLGANGAPDGLFQVYIKSDILWETYNINGLNTQIIDITGLIYEPIFSKNSAFNLNFGSTSLTVMEGNDSRVVNGETAFNWGNHNGLYPLLSGSYTNPTWIASLPYTKITGVPTIPNPQVQTDWNATTGIGVLLNKPTFSSVAVTGAYSDLIGTPIIPTDNSQITNSNGYITASSSNTITNKSGNISQWTNNSGYLTSFTELDPTTPAYSKTLSAFSVIKSSTDPLYKAIGYTPTSLEITTALGFIPYNSTNPAGYISSIPAQSFSSLTGKPTTLSGYGITDAYPITGNPSNFLTTVSSGQVTTALGYTPVTNTRSLTINGLTQDLTANRTWTVGDVTTANLTAGLATKENSISSGTNLQYWRGDKTWQTLNTTSVPEATNLYYTDSRSRASISLTTTGSGSATYNSTTGALNIPNLAGGTVTSITAGAGLSGGVITGIGTISMPNTGTPGTYNTVTTDTQGRVISGTVSTPSSVTVTLNTSSKISTAQATRVSYSVTHTIALTLLLSSGSSMAYLEISPDNSTWSTISQAGYSDGVAIAVVLTKTVTNNIQGEVPANYFRRIRVVTSGGGSATYTCGQETIY